MVIPIKLGHMYFCKITFTLSEDSDKPAYPCRPIILCCLDEDAVRPYSACVEDRSDCVDAQADQNLHLHTHLFVELIVFQKIQFVRLHKINIYIFGHDYFPARFII